MSGTHRPSWAGFMCIQRSTFYRHSSLIIHRHIRTIHRRCGHSWFPDVVMNDTLRTLHRSVVKALPLLSVDVINLKSSKGRSAMPSKTIIEPDSRVQ